MNPPDRLQYRRLRVPREDRSALVDPPWDAMSGLIEENLRLRGEYKYDFQGRSLRALSADARRELLAEARRWTAAYRDADSAPEDAQRPIFLAGHQPQLVHPGVWFKNFALDRLARRHGAVAVNLVVDNDTAKSTSARVPGGTPDAPDAADVVFDVAAETVPYEERRIVDRACFETFGRRAADRIGRLVPNSMIEQYWPLAVRRSRETDNLGACLAQSRHELEGRWGLRTLEIPTSRVCRSEPFAWFVAHLLANLQRLRRTHNEIVHEYRRANRIRSASHPVPDLAAQGEWFEAPFWVWTGSDPRRRAVFARRGTHAVELTDRASLRVELPLTADAPADRAVERLIALAAEGVKIRCRTLMTTLWARLVLGDVFLHGIGGAKYDEVTDALIERFFGLRPPSFFTLSATLQLPIPQTHVAPPPDREIRGRLRELEYHPERFVEAAEASSNGAVRSLVVEKARWIETPKTPENAHERHQAIRHVNAALQGWLQRERERLVMWREEATRARRAEEILASREYAACLYPETVVREGLRGLLG
jgi:hypothetical protein